MPKIYAKIILGTNKNLIYVCIEKCLIVLCEFKNQ